MNALQLQVIFKYKMAPLIPFGEDVDYFFLWQGYNKSIFLSVLLRLGRFLIFIVQS